MASELPPSIFVPHGMRCEADDGRPDFGRCSEPASARVQDQNRRERYVCHQHYVWWIRDHSAALPAAEREPR